jgi:hypothetical protein
MWFCGGQSGTEAGFLRVLRFPLPIFIPPVAPQSPSPIIWGWYNRSVVAVLSSGHSLTPRRIIIKKQNKCTQISCLEWIRSHHPGLWQGEDNSYLGRVGTVIGNCYVTKVQTFSQDYLIYFCPMWASSSHLLYEIGNWRSAVTDLQVIPLSAHCVRLTNQEEFLIL